MTTVDRAIARQQLPRHAEPKALAALLHRLASSLEQDGTRAEELVGLLSARGWSASTLGDGGARSTDDTSSTERAADAKGAMARWAGADVNYHGLLRALETAAHRFDHVHTDVLAHAGDEDPVPAGTGECEACGRFCRPTKDRPGFRLRAGLCPSCDNAYRNDGRPYPRGDWVRARRARLTDDRGVVHPEDDSDIDMSIEHRGGS